MRHLWCKLEGGAHSQGPLHLPFYSIYLRPSSRWDKTRTQVCNETFQGDIQTVHIYSIDQTQASLQRKDACSYFMEKASTKNKLLWHLLPGKFPFEPSRFYSDHGINFKQQMLLSLLNFPPEPEALNELLRWVYKKQKSIICKTGVCA